MKKILTLIILTLLLSGCTKTKSITCEASETEAKTNITTKVISKYNYNKSGLKILSIDYTIEVSGDVSKDNLIATKNMFENTICGKSKPSNIKCEILLTDEKVAVISNEEIKDNKSSLLGIGNLDELTYNKFKENEKDNKNCKFE